MGCDEVKRDFTNVGGFENPHLVECKSTNYMDLIIIIVSPYN